MVFINLLQVPQYLRASPYFLSLNVPDDQLDQFSLDIPDRCLMPNTASIRSICDLHHFLRTICFWEYLQLIGTCTSFFEFVFHPNKKKKCLEAFPEYMVDIPELSTIKAVLLAPQSVRLRLAAELGSLELVHFLSMKNHDQCAEFEAVCAAGRFGNVDCLHYLLGWSRYDHDVYKAAVLENNTCFLSSVLLTGVRPTKEDANLAASKGCFDCLRQLIWNDCPVDAETARSAARNGHIECLRLLSESGKPIWREDIDFFSFVRYAKPTAGELSCLKYIHTIGYKCTVETFTNFVFGDRIDCAVWMIRNVPDLSFDACNIVAQHGSVDYLMALRSAGCKCADDICTVAASAGNVDVLIYLYAEGIMAGTEAITAAAENGRFASLELLHENDCPWDESTALAAGRSGRHYLRYVLDGGCPCAKTVFSTNAIASRCDINTLIFFART